MKINGKENQQPQNYDSLLTNEDSSLQLNGKKGGYKNLEHLRMIKRPFELMVPDDDLVQTQRTEDCPVEEA